MAAILEILSSGDGDLGIPQDVSSWDSENSASERSMATGTSTDYTVDILTKTYNCDITI